MNRIGTVESLWRYPVKSMRGEELPEIFAGFSGVYGDRLFAFESSASPADFPYLTARNQCHMILYRPRFRNSVEVAANSGYGKPSDLMVDVKTPAGATLAIDDLALIDALRAGIDDSHQITLRRSDRAMTDCRPVSLISLQTVQKLAEETGAATDKRRFRANIYLDLDSSGGGFNEDRFVGQRLRLGSNVVLSILQRDGRCMMITLDPDTADRTPALLKTVAQAHDGKAGIYAAVATEGIVRKGDVVELLN
jgi:uncharacterized protein YcbX